MSRGWETTALLLRAGRTKANRVVLPAAFSRPPSRCDPCSFRPPLLHCFCADGRASVACSCRDRQCPRKRQGKVRERQAWNVGTWLKNGSALYGDDYRNRREQSYSMSVASHTSVLKDRQGDENGLSCSVVASSTKDPSDGFVGHAVISSNLAQGFVVFHDTAYHVRPFFRWDAIVRLTWTCILL